jgi:Fe-S cluster assembly protein SufD
MSELRAVTLNPEELPTPKDERWKYTNLGRALPADLEPEVLETKTIHSSSGKDSGQTVEMSFNGSDNKALSQEIKIIVEDNTSFTLIENHKGDGAYWKNMAFDVDIGANAHFKHVRFIEDGSDAVVTLNTHVSQKRDSSYKMFTVLSGTKLTRNEVTVAIQGSTATSDLRGLNLLEGKQVGDQTYLVEHQEPHCESNQLVRSVLRDQARGVYQGKIHVFQPAQKTNAYQMSNALILDEGAEMNTKPELEIYADDVACSHGTTTGRIEEDQLFYMRARGIPEDEAKSLLIEAFLAEVFDGIDDDALHERALGAVQAWLKQ